MMQYLESFLSARVSHGLLHPFTMRFSYIDR